MRNENQKEINKILNEVSETLKATSNTLCYNKIEDVKALFKLEFEQDLQKDLETKKIKALVTYKELISVFGGGWKTVNRTKIFVVDDLLEINKLGNDLIDVKILQD